MHSSLFVYTAWRVRGYCFLYIRLLFDLQLHILDCRLLLLLNSRHGGFIENDVSAVNDFHALKIIEAVTLLASAIAQHYTLSCLTVKFVSLCFRHMRIGTASKYTKEAHIWLGTAPCCFTRGDSSAWLDFDSGDIQLLRGPQPRICEEASSQPTRYVHPQLVYG